MKKLEKIALTLVLTSVGLVAGAFGIGEGKELANNLIYSAIPTSIIGGLFCAKIVYREIKNSSLGLYPS